MTIHDPAAWQRANELMSEAREKRREAARLVAEAEQTQALANLSWMAALGREMRA